MKRKIENITKKTKFSDIVKDKEASDVLSEKGMHCLGCPFSSVESLEQGARAHGLDADELVEEIKKRRKKK